MKLNDKRELIDARNVNLTASKFDDTNLSQTKFTNANLTGARFNDVNMTNVTIDNANLDGMKIRGVLVSDLFAAYEGRT